MTTHDAIRQHIFETLGVFDRRSPPDVVRRITWSAEFEGLLRGASGPAANVDRGITLMRNRLVVGFYRYGSEALGHAVWPYYDCRFELLNRWRAWLATRDTEYLIDYANFCYLLWLSPPPGTERNSLLMRCALALYLFETSPPEAFIPVDRCY